MARSWRGVFLCSKLGLRRSAGTEVAMVLVAVVTRAGNSLRKADRGEIRLYVLLQALQQLWFLWLLLPLLWRCFPRPGIRPGGRPPFWHSPKGRRKSCPLLSAPLRCAAGGPAPTCLWGAPRNSLRALQALHSNRRGESVHEAGCVLRHSQPPQSQAVAGAAKRGKSGTDGRPALGRNILISYKPQ